MQVRRGERCQIPPFSLRPKEATSWQLWGGGWGGEGVMGMEEEGEEWKRGMEEGDEKVEWEHHLLGIRTELKVIICVFFFFHISNSFPVSYLCHVMRRCPLLSLNLQSFHFHFYGAPEGAPNKPKQEFRQIIWTAYLGTCKWSSLKCPAANPEMWTTVQNMQPLVCNRWCTTLLRTPVSSHCKQNMCARSRLISPGLVHRLIGSTSSYYWHHCQDLLCLRESIQETPTNVGLYQVLPVLKCGTICPWTHLKFSTM